MTEILKRRLRGRMVVATVLVAISTLGTAVALRGQDAAASKKAPPTAQKPLEVVDADRYLAHVAEFHGKPLMVTFWATWCEPCRDEYPMVIELARQYAPKGLNVFGVDLDDDAEEPLALRFLAKTQPVFTNYRKRTGKEEEFINRVNTKWSGVLPATFFYSPDGRLVGQIVGEQKREAFVTAIEQLLAAPLKN
jgi:thiol-disulfide isomerase/thioredoxin